MHSFFNTEAARFRELDHLRPCPFVEASPAKISEIPELVEIATAKIPAVKVRAATVQAVHEHNPESIFAFKVKGKIEGGVGFLYFNDRGLDALLLDEVNIADPDHALLSKPGEAPAALYIWAMAARGRSVAATGTMSNLFHQNPYRLTDYYVRPATQDGERFSRELGFHPVVCFQKNLWSYQRLANRNRAALPAVA